MKHVMIVAGLLAANATPIAVGAQQPTAPLPPAIATIRQPRALQPTNEVVRGEARLLQGQKAWSMVAGAGPEGGFDVALFVGYHARAGHPTGTIAHTFSGRPTETRLNGRPVGETGLNASVLGQWGIPVGLVAGDDAAARSRPTGTRPPSSTSRTPRR